jgi:limonene-1,2-epoxide hydrolase
MENSKRVVEQFWAVMQTNDFRAAGDLLHNDYLPEWPQSGERIRGRENFVAINTQYPALERWNFTVHRILAEGDQAVSDVSVTDGAISARVITFPVVAEGKSSARLNSGRVLSKPRPGVLNGLRKSAGLETSGEGVTTPGAADQLPLFYFVSNYVCMTQTILPGQVKTQIGKQTR